LPIERVERGIEVVEIVVRWRRSFLGRDLLGRGLRAKIFPLGGGTVGRDRTRRRAGREFSFRHCVDDFDLSTGGRRLRVGLHSQQLFDSADHERRFDRFFEHAVRAARRQTCFIDRLEGAGQQQHRHTAQPVVAPHELRKIVAADLRQGRARQHDVGLVRDHLLHRLPSITDGDDVDRLAGKGQRDHPLDRDAVVREKECAHAPGYPWVSAGRL
jgi:hypothetical protein